MALGSTKPLIEMSTRNIFWGVKAPSAQGSQPSCADCLEIWEPQPPGMLRACPCMKWDCFMFPLFSQYIYKIRVPDDGFGIK